MTIQNMNIIIICSKFTGVNIILSWKCCIILFVSIQCQKYKIIITYYTNKELLHINILHPEKP